VIRVIDLCNTSHYNNNIHTYLKGADMSSLVNIRIDDETRQRLDRLASATDRTRSHLVKKAIEEYLCANEWQVQEIEKAIRQADAPEAVFVEHDRVDTWLNSWGSDKETERPR